MSAFVDSKVDNFSLGRYLTLFNFGPFACRLRQPNFNAHLRIENLPDGTISRKEDGRITANWEMVFQGEPLVTFREATLESLNGSVKMNLDPKKLELSKVFKAISDLCSTYNDSGDGFVTGI